MWVLRSFDNHNDEGLIMPLAATVGKSVKQLSQRVLILGIVLAVLGVICLVVPFQTGMAISVILGLFFIAGGVIRAMFAFIGLTWGSTLLRLLFGALMVVVGLWMVINPDAGVRVMSLWLAVYFLVDGILGVIYSFQLRPIGGGGWVLLDGLMGVVLAWMIWSQWPFSGDAAVGILIGIKLILDGGALISLGIAGRALGSTVEEIPQSKAV